MKTKHVCSLVFFLFISNFMYSQEKKPIVISTRLGLNSFVEANLYADIPLDDRKGLAFGIGSNFMRRYQQSICNTFGSEQLSKFFLKEGFKLKAGLNFYSPPWSTNTIMLDYRYGIVRDLLVNYSCESTSIDRSDRVDFKTHQIGIMYYYDKNIFEQWAGAFFGLGAGLNFVEQTVLTDNNRKDSDIYGVYRFDVGFRINMRIKR